MAYPSPRGFRLERVYAHATDISTAGSYFVPSPARGKIVKVGSMINNAITTADDVITVEINGTAVTGAGFTIATSGSAAGTFDSATPTALNFVNENDAIEFVNTGASDTTCAAVFFADILVG
jgi:hypothetical protein